MSPEAAEEVVASVVVVVADADAGLPAGAGQSGFFGDVGESSVAIVFVQMRGRSFSGGPLLVQLRAVGEVDVKPSVVVIVEKGEAAAFGFDDVALVIGGAPDVGDGRPASLATSTNTTASFGGHCCLQWVLPAP